MTFIKKKRPPALGLTNRVGLRAVKSRTSPKSARTGVSMGKMKKELDRVFSLFIRAKYPKFCYTCNKPSERLQNGHFISRIYLVTRWEEKNCRPQCWGCNGYGKGQPLIFEENLKAEYGNDLVEKMKASRHQILKLDRNWYTEKIDFYKKELEMLSPH